jgi:hypothetical protein
VEIESRQRSGNESLLQQPALMFAVKGPSAINRSAAAEENRFDAHGRRQNPKTPVEQALMRGLDTA